MLMLPLREKIFSSDFSVNTLEIGNMVELIRDGHS